MFNKFGARDSGPETSAEQPAQSVSTATAAVDKVKRRDSTVKQSASVIGKAMVMKGELVADEDLLIQGRFEGSVKQNAKNLTVGTHGKVEANIDGQSVVIQGTVRGDIRGGQSVIIEPSAEVQGNVYSSNIGLEQGAKFKGKIDSCAQRADQPRKKATASDDSVSDEAVNAILDA